MNEVRRDLKDQASRKKVKRISEWLLSPVLSTNHNKALQQRQKGTGSWLIENSAFKNWISKPTAFLWLHGIPGCGKTILSSTIIEHLQNVRVPNLLYFYFDFTDIQKQNFRGVICSLMLQLYQICDDAQEPLEALHSACGDGNTQPSCESLCQILQEMIEQAKEISIVLDAIDECAERKGTPTEGILAWIRDLVENNDNIRCLVTSRPEHDIKEAFSRLTTEKNRISLQNDLVDNDILAYIHAKVKNGEELRRWQSRPDVQKEIEETLSKMANGM